MDCGGFLSAEQPRRLHHFQVPFGKGVQAYASHTVHPFLTAVLTDGAGEKGVDTEVGLVKKYDKIVYECVFAFGEQSKLTVDVF